MTLAKVSKGLHALICAAALTAACAGRSGASGEVDPCDRLSAQCEACSNEDAEARCFQAVSLALDSTCVQLLESGTYASVGVECTY